MGMFVRGREPGSTPARRRERGWALSDYRRALPPLPVARGALGHDASAAALDLGSGVT